ncbi:MAG: dienelactone hydrolase family protein [Promethearchaeota archaeon]
MKISEENVTIKCSDGVDLKAYITWPLEKGKYPGLIVIHEIWGLNDQIKGVARRYAEHGYAVVAPHLFSSKENILKEENIRKAMIPVFSIPRDKRSDPSSLKSIMDNMSDNDKDVVRLLFLERESLEKNIISEAKDCYNYFSDLPSVNNEKMGVTGFCFGGGLALHLSTLIPFTASVIFYGANPKSIDSVSKINGPVLSIYAGEDTMLGAGIPSLVEAMFKYKKTFAMKLYEGVQHAFFNETSSVYNEAAAEDAWLMVLNFFNTYLK